MSMLVMVVMYARLLVSVDNDPPLSLKTKGNTEYATGKDCLLDILR